MAEPHYDVGSAILYVPVEVAVVIATLAHGDDDDAGDFHGTNF